MGIFRSKQANIQEDPTRNLNAKVDQQLLQQQVDELFRFKILLLGAGESGKSTVVKQLEVIHKKKKSTKEIKMIAQSLHQNVIDCMKALIYAAKNFGYWNPDEVEKKTEESIFNHDESERISPELGERILQLYKSEAITQTYDRRAEYWLLDSFPYYIKNIERFCEVDFNPNEDDIVMARIRTTGIAYTELEHRIVQDHKDEPDMLKFKIVDVGGQRNERKKWMHCFDDVRAVLFIVNLAGYNQVLFEDATKNRMIEELELFEQITHNKIFANTPLFLFLNKKDLFESMVTEVDMKRTFADYDGGKNLSPALNYIQDRFRKLLPAGKELNVQVVSARWKQDVRAAFDEVKKVLYDMNRLSLLKQAGDLKNKHKQITKELEKGSSASGCMGF